MEKYVRDIEKIEKKSGRAWFLENRWKIAFGVIVVVFLILLLADRKSSGEEIGQQIADLVDAQVPENVVLQGVSEESGLYKVDLLFQGQLISLYATKDGKLFGTMQPLVTTDSGSVGLGNVVEVSEDDDAFKGDEDAEIVIIEFSDFECPLCGLFWRETLPLIEEEYIDTGKVKFVFRDFPLSSIHENAQKASEASECARDQGGDDVFWDYHDVLFDNQDALDEVNLKSYAKQLGLDSEEFDECLDSGKFEQEVLDDFQDGVDAGVPGTPTFFINGKPISGAQPYSVFREAIESELALL